MHTVKWSILLVLNVLKRLYPGCFGGDFDKFYGDIVKQWTFKPQLYQIGKSWFCVQICGKNGKLHSVILVINDRSKSPVCNILSRFSIWSLPARYDYLNEQKLSTMKLAIYIVLWKRPFRIPVNTKHTAVYQVSPSAVPSCEVLYLHWILGHKTVRKVKFWDSRKRLD